MVMNWVISSHLWHNVTKLKHLVISYCFTYKSSTLLGTTVFLCDRKQYSMTTVKKKFFIGSIFKRKLNKVLTLTQDAFILLRTVILQFYKNHLRCLAVIAMRRTDWQMKGWKRLKFKRDLAPLRQTLHLFNYHFTQRNTLWGIELQTLDWFIRMPTTVYFIENIDN